MAEMEGNAKKEGEKQQREAITENRVIVNAL